VADIIPPVHLRLRRALGDASEQVALRAALTASHLLGLATGTHLRRLRAERDALVQLQARLEEAELRARLATEALEILGARFARLPERRRPHFSPGQRFRILEIRNLLGWSAHEVARVFLVCSNTVLNWEAVADPETTTVGCTVKPAPPVRRAADVARALAGRMVALGFGGQDLVARILARAGWKVSARSVGRYRRERLSPPPSPAPAQPKSTRPVVARFVHHVWMMDVSVVHQFLGPDLLMAAVFDAFSRAPLALEVCDRGATAFAMARLLRAAARAFGAPKYLITDLGPEFTGQIFQKAVRRLGSVQRFGSKENLYATARLERFWRTLKENADLYGFGLPLTFSDLEKRLALALFHYVCFRPHEGLGGATPAETFLGRQPACRRAVEPPRGRPGEKTGGPPFAFGYLDPVDRRFPVLTPAA
jgi:transposase InsO family protein